ncbi:hypothetical protein Y032_0006g2921 [Ancylostoma ceylanicum]|uniref:Uncharacterized protein n=1 Tax=Ancylostoma ceylanicum TaxID=53326 RepID=A0A016VPS5_9BILA|nr:hypothetical protein Y032_0006g2921 [Ancylostoma ceylanicum]
MNTWLRFSKKTVRLLFHLLRCLDHLQTSLVEDESKRTLIETIRIDCHVASPWIASKRSSSLLIIYISQRYAQNKDPNEAIPICEATSPLGHPQTSPAIVAKPLSSRSPRPPSLATWIK